MDRKLTFIFSLCFLVLITFSFVLATQTSISVTPSDIIITPSAIVEGQEITINIDASPYGVEAVPFFKKGTTILDKTFNICSYCDCEGSQYCKKKNRFEKSVSSLLQRNSSHPHV